MDGSQSKWSNVRNVLTVALGCAALLGLACGNDPPDDGGSSGISCGGITGAPCPTGMYCDFALGSCGQGDALGICEPIPTACAKDCRQVCGCDARSYCNACMAASAGVDIASGMSCDDPPPASK